MIILINIHHCFHWLTAEGLQAVRTEAVHLFVTNICKNDQFARKFLEQSSK
jgi:hypothetical protein